MTSCEVNHIFLGEVAAVQNYGAFVRIPGCAQQGLIHKSQISSSHVDDVTEVLQRGERVWCKVISINGDGKISLSMKLVNQGNGTDLDPTGVQQQKEEQKRRQLVPGQRKVIQLQAVLNTTCAKCGTHGHLSTDCFMSPGGKTYELLPEIEEEVGEVKLEVVDPHVKVKKHKSKKSKGKKKPKKSKSNQESPASDSRSEDLDKNNRSGKKRAKEKKKEQKKKKKSRENSLHETYSTVENDDRYERSKSSLKRKCSHEQDRERRTKKCKYSTSKH